MPNESQSSPRDQEMSAHSTEKDRRPVALLTFQLDGHVYGALLDPVQELVPLMTLSPIPRGPEFVDGLARIRNDAVPVVDTRSCLGMERASPTRGSRIIVTRLEAGLLGLVVDRVLDVVELDQSAARDLAILNDSTVVPKRGGFVMGVARIGNDLVQLVRLDGLLDGAQLARLFPERTSDGP